jgi:hypothetical protein
MKKLLLAATAVGLVTGMGNFAFAQEYTIGVSNTVQGNGWREEMICAMKAQALDSGLVASLNIAHRNTDAAGQLEDIRNLIEAGVDAIVVNPASPDAINSAIAEATERGIVVVAVDQAVSEESAYVVSNDQEEYGYVGAKWLFETIGGEGTVVYMRGAAGARPTTTAIVASAARSKSSPMSASSRRCSPAGSRIRASSRSSTDRDRHSLRRRLDLGHRQRNRRRVRRIRCPAGADRRCRQCGLRRPAQHRRRAGRRGRHQPRFDRRRRRDAGAADPRRRSLPIVSCW